MLYFNVFIFIVFLNIRELFIFILYNINILKIIILGNIIWNILKIFLCKRRVYFDLFSLFRDVMRDLFEKFLIILIILYSSVVFTWINRRNILLVSMLRAVVMFLRKKMCLFVLVIMNFIVYRVFFFILSVKNL